MTQAAMTKTTTEMSDRAMVLEEKVIERLRTVFDPEIPVNLYDLGLIYKIDFQPAMECRFDLNIEMTLTTPNCPVAQEMPEKVRLALIDMKELHEVTVELVWDPPWDRERMSDEVKLQLNMF